jgi:hypothetical protein
MKILRHLSDPKVAVAEGVRFSTHLVLRKLEEYVLKERDTLNISLDNTIFRTQIVKNVNGFLSKCPIGVDQYLRENILKAGYKWIVDKTVISGHIRFGLGDVTSCMEFHPSSIRTIRDTLIDDFKILVKSPLSGLKAALITRCPEIFSVYPYLRLHRFKNLVKYRSK